MGHGFLADMGSSDFINRKLKELIVLAEMNKEIHSTMNINQLLKILVEKVSVGVNFERCLIYLLEDDYLRCVAWIDRIKVEMASIIEKRVGFRMDEQAIEVEVVKTGKPIYVADALQDRRVSPKILRVYSTTEYGVIPLVGRNRVLGVLTGDKFYSKTPILPEDMESLQLFAGHISLAIENAMLYEEKEKFNLILEKTVRERTSELVQANQDISAKMAKLSSLYQMARLLDDGLEQKAVLNQIATLLGSLGFDAFSVSLLQDGGSKPVLIKNMEEGIPECAAFLRMEETTEEFWRSPHVFSAANAVSDNAPVACRHFFEKRNLQSFIVIPIVSKGEKIGILTVYSQNGAAFFDEQKDFFYTFGQQVGVALENAISYQRLMDEKNHIKTISERIEQENLYLKERIKTRFVTGKSPGMLEVMELVKKVAPNTTTVVIYGETGTGKEHIANAIHEMSPRSSRPLVKVNCAAIPDDLIESELFGHEKGAFTGAYEKRVGMFELAHGGTIFLDEVGDLSMKTQTKLLRVLQEQEIQRIGSKATIRVDVRVIAATNKDLQKEIEAARFRSDLYYRLAVFPITLSPLRERKEDIEALIDFFLEKYAYIRQRKMKISRDVIDVLLTCPWPGNVRELENIVERLIIVSKSDTITLDDLPAELKGDSASTSVPARPLGEALQEFKKKYVIQALAAVGGKKSTAAEILGMPRSNFSRLLKSLKLL